MSQTADLFKSDKKAWPKGDLYLESTPVKIESVWIAIVETKQDTVGRQSGQNKDGADKARATMEHCGQSS